MDSKNVRKKNKLIDSERRSYEKPKVRRIELVAGEVLATGCKTPTHYPAPTVSTPCGLSTCVLVGS